MSRFYEKVRYVGETALIQAQDGLGYEIFDTPFYSFSYHCSAVLNPISHCLKLIINAAALAASVFFLIGAAVYKPKESVPAAWEAFKGHLGGLFFSALSLAISPLTFVLKTIDSIRNGYLWQTHATENLDKGLEAETPVVEVKAKESSVLPQKLTFFQRQKQEFVDCIWDLNIFQYHPPRA